MGLADAGEHGVGLGVAAGDRAVSDDRHIMGPAGGGDLRLVEKRMHLDLVADQRLAREPDRFIDQRDREVGHADMAGQTVLLDPAQGAQRFGQGYQRVRPVQEQQIDLGQAQPGEAALGGMLELMGGEMRRPYLGGQENIVAPDPGRVQRLPDLALVVVHFRRVDMAISQPQRLLHHPRTDAPAQLPGTQTDERNAGAPGLNDVHRGSRCH